jgi:hypothetical protein
MAARIPPLEEPYDPQVRAQLDSMMPAGVEAIGLFRMFARNLAMTAAMHGWGRYELGPRMSVPMRAREIVIGRTTARCGAEYEWGVHVAYYAERVGLTRSQLRSITVGGAGDQCWTDPTDRLLIEVVDQLHDTADLDDALWSRFALTFGPEQILDVVLLCGWYHAISFVARATRVANEPFAPTFQSVMA